MKYLVKDQEGKVYEMMVPGALELPPGFELVPAEEIDAEMLKKHREKALAKIRAKRDEMLLKNDKAYLVASKKGEDLEAIKADAQLLRDLPEGAAADLEALVVEAGIESYDPFPSLGLSREY